jgi:hypothetical protein
VRDIYEAAGGAIRPPRARELESWSARSTRTSSSRASTRSGLPRLRRALVGAAAR